MVLVNGVYVSERGAQTLLDLLSRAGRADDATAAENLQVAILEDAADVELDDAELEAIVRVLADPPETLVELTAALARKRSNSN